MASNLYITESDLFDGTAEILIQDKVSGDPTRFGRLTDIELDVTSQSVTPTKVINGEIIECEDRIKSRKGMLKGKIGEFGPDAAQLMLHTYGQSPTIENNTICTYAKWRQRLNATDQYPFIEGSGWGTDSLLNPITGIVFSDTSVTGTAGGWTAAPWTCYVVPVYLGKGNTQADIPAGTAAASFQARENLPGYYTFGKLSAVSGATPGATDTTMQVIVTQAAIKDDEPLPSGWAVFVGLTSGGIAAAKFDCYKANTLTVAGGSQTVAVQVKSDSGNEIFAAKKKISVCVETGYASGTISYTGPSGSGLQCVEGVDYSFDENTGFVSRISGGGITNQQMVRIVVWTLRGGQETYVVGQQSRNTDYREAWIYALSPNPDTANGRPSLADGWIMHLRRLNFAGMAFNLTMNEENMMPPVPFECKVLADGSQGFGEWIHRSLRNKTFAQGFS